MKFSFRARLSDVVVTSVLVFGTMSLLGQVQSSIPDAQVESNVLRALAAAPELSTQNIQTSAVYGTVTLSGNVHDEDMRTRAENLAARAVGVKKVVDQLTVGDTQSNSAVGASSSQPIQNEQMDNGQAGQPVLLSDGTYGPPPDGSGNPSVQQDAGNEPANQPQQDTLPPQVPKQDPGPRQPMYQRSDAPQAIPGGQQAGLNVTVPAGSMLRIRINRGLDSNHIQPGTAFDGVVLTDVIAGGAVAIPRGAAVSGIVVDAKKAGVFKGQGELSLQVNSLTLGGNVYAITTDVWTRNGRDKTAGTVGNTVGTSAFGALIGAIAGGGAGAAIGAGVGAGAGLAGSAASPRGQIIVPPESVLTFITAVPTPIRTVSEQEMSRLAYAAGPRRPQRPRYSPGPYYGPQPY
jgi:hypothetical protein